MEIRKIKKASLQIKIIIFFLFALYTILPDYFRIFGVTSQVVVAFCIFFLYVINGGNFRISKRGTIYILLYTVPMIITYLYNGDFFYIIKFVLERAFLIMILYSTIKTREEFNSLIDILLKFAVLESISAYIHFVFNFNVFSIISNATDLSTLTADTQYRLGMVRVEGSFGHPITFAIYLSICLWLCLYMYSQFSRVKYRIYYVMMCIALLLTIERLPLIIFIASQIVYLLIQNPKKLRRILTRVVVLIPILLLLVFILPDQVMEVPKNILNMVTGVFSSESLMGISSYNDESAFSYRSAMLKVLPTQMENHWLFGIGSQYNTSFSFYINNHVQHSIDNQYLYYFVVYGIFGLTESILWVIGITLVSKRYFSVKSTKKFQYYSRFIIFVYALNLFSVAEMYEYKIVIVFMSLCLIDIRLNNISSQTATNYKPLQEDQS
ncbi:MAG: O-antigen ligase family protein [Desulfosporosinus sp.]|nr:O-antigen ligase family protein [Desulfosporosinus sp.]